MFLLTPTGGNRSRSPGAAPELGHSKEAFGATPAQRKASGFQPGDSCNGHSGFLVNPPPGEP
jgi:hypothetical protein